jgi:hypothetical protein
MPGIMKIGDPLPRGLRGTIGERCSADVFDDNATVSVFSVGA